MSSIDLQGRKALVTGGTKGIGAAVSARLREAGALVLATARTAPREAVDGVLFVAADVTNEGTDVRQLSNLAVQAQENLGAAKLDVVADKG